VQEVVVVVVDSRLALEARARQALVGLYPILALVPPILVAPPTPTLVVSPATGSQTASLTDSVKEPRDVVLILALTMLRLAGLPVVGELIVRQPATRLFALVQGITLVTHLSPVVHSPLRIFADQILVALTLTANLALTTGQARIGQYACATKDTEGTV